MKLRYYQDGAVKAVLDYLISSPSKHPVVSLPTGAGKSLCIADLIKHLELDNNILVLSHVKEILEQNAKTITDYTGMNVSVNSSMLGRREIGGITVAGIQSVFRDTEMFSLFDVVIIDEAHRISPEEGTMYQKFFSGIGKHTRVGFTATAFRLGTGYIFGDTSDTLFDALVYDYSTRDKFTELVKAGYLCPLTTKRTKLEMDTSKVKMIGGDFSSKSLSEEFDRIGVTNKAIKEILAAGANRKKWMIFAIDINHAEHIAEVLIRSGIPTCVVHSKMSESGFDRNRIIEDLRNGKYRCVVNIDILTTGYDDSGIDLIACLRPTCSPVLHVQSLGRGSRIEDGKDNCLVLDFAGNTARLGPINDVLVKVKGKGKGNGEPITKTCPECDSILAVAVRKCPDCGHKFKFRHGLSACAITTEVMDDGKPRWLSITDVIYEVNSKPTGPSSLLVTYKTEGDVDVKEWVCVEHRGFAKHKADHWVKFRGGEPVSNARLLKDQADTLSVPKEILVSKKGTYYIVQDSKF